MSRPAARVTKLAAERGTKALPTGRQYSTATDATEIGRKRGAVATPSGI